MSSLGELGFHSEKERYPRMHEQWTMINEFPNYSVSDTGEVRNDDTDYILTKLVNQQGVVHVGLTRDRVIHKRSLTVLVADTYLPKDVDVFDTPINLDGDRFNNHVDNLMWRPRWFASKYFRQFAQSAPCFTRPVQIVETGEIFDTSWDAATTLGLLDREIALSIMSGGVVGITMQHFRLVK